METQLLSSIQKRSLSLSRLLQLFQGSSIFSINTYKTPKTKTQAAAVNLAHLHQAKLKIQHRHQYQYLHHLHL
jgi:hypothetical protein